MNRFTPRRIRDLLIGGAAGAATALTGLNRGVADLDQLRVRGLRDVAEAGRLDVRGCEDAYVAPERAWMQALASRSDACRYDAGRARVEAYVTGESARVAALGPGLSVHPGNRTLAFIHAAQTTPPRPTIVLHHGFSAGTLQWNTPSAAGAPPAATDRYAEQLFARGFNVLVPRAPGHGVIAADGEAATANVPGIAASPEAWARFADETVELARGLGGPVLVAGLSGGADVALLSAARHPEVRGVLVLAPFLRSARAQSVFHVAERVPFAASLLDRLSVEIPGARPTPEQPRAYGFWKTSAGSTIGLHEMGTRILRDADRLADRDVSIIYTEADGTVSNDAIHTLAARITSAGGAPRVHALERAGHAMLSSIENRDRDSLKTIAGWMDGFFAPYAPAQP